MASETRQAMTVKLFVAEDSLLTITDGVDVAASTQKYADILENEMERLFGGEILNLEIEVVRLAPYESVQIIADDYQFERELRGDIHVLEQKILAGDYGDWIVEAAE